MRAVSRFAVQVRASTALLASPFGRGGRAQARSERVRIPNKLRIPSQSRLTPCQLSQRESQERLRRFFTHCFLLLGCGGRWRVWADVVIGPYEAVEARTCTANEISARIPHPPLRGTFPPGEGLVVLLPSVGGCGGIRWVWADVPQSAPTAWLGGAVVCGGLWAILESPLRRDWGCGNL